MAAGRAALARLIRLSASEAGDLFQKARRLPGSENPYQKIRLQIFNKVVFVSVPVLSVYAVVMSV